MVEQTIAPVSRVDVERLYADNWLPESWVSLEERTVQLLEEQQFSAEQTRVVVFALRELAAQGRAVPGAADELYLLMRPILERMPGGYG